MGINSPQKFSCCCICGSELGKLNLDIQLYCIRCVEEMERLNMSAKRYRKHRELRENLPGK